jgi:hypothetical protein
MTPPTSGTGDKHYRHIQREPANQWDIPHGLQKYPAVTVVDSAKSVVIGDVTHVDANNVKLSFSATFSGEAYLN